MSSGYRIAVVGNVISPFALKRTLGAALALVLAASPVLAQSSDSKIDLSLRDALRSGAATQTVIITVDDPALRDGIRLALQAHGDVIKAEHPLVGAFTAEIHSDDV